MTKSLHIVPKTGLGIDIFNTYERSLLFSLNVCKILEQNLTAVKEVKVKRKRPQHIYRSSQLRYGSLVGEWTTITSVWHQDTRKKHWTQVVSIQDIHCERGGGGSPFVQILCTVLWERKKQNKKNKQPTQWTDVPHTLAKLWTGAPDDSHLISISPEHLL